MKPYAEGVCLKRSVDYPVFDVLIRERNQLIASIEQFALLHGVSNQRAKASVWHMHYTLRILPSILVAQSLSCHSLPLKLDKLSIDLSNGRIFLPHQGRANFQSDATSRYYSLIFEHLTPLHQFLHQHFGIAESVLWSNCLFRLGSFVKTIVAAVGRDARLLNDLDILTNSKYLAGEKNPLKFETIMLQDQQGLFCLRPKCCFLHETSTRSYCHDCPKNPEVMALRKQTVTETA